jgi:hypothetical protein
LYRPIHPIGRNQRQGDRQRRLGKPKAGAHCGDVHRKIALANGNQLTDALLPIAIEHSDRFARLHATRSHMGELRRRYFNAGSGLQSRLRDVEPEHVRTP